MVTDPKYGSCLIAMAGLTRFFKRSSPHPLMKAQGTTLVRFFSILSDRYPFWCCPLLCLLIFISVAARHVRVCQQLWYCLSPSAGEAVTFTRQYVLTPSAGRRPRVPGVVVIIADKKSADNLTLAASSLRATGVLEQNNKQSHCSHL